MSPRLKVERLAKSYSGGESPLRAVQEVSLEVGPGEFVAIQGPSGCGKTTLILCAGALLQPTSGRVVLDAQDLYALSGGQRAHLRATRIGFVFQQFHLIPYLSVRDNLLVPALACPVDGLLDRVDELLGHFGLRERANHLAADLSTGERQRTALARALVPRPKLLLADEPTGNLDAENGEVVLRYLAEFARGGGTVLLVTHDPRAARHAHRILTMARGTIVEAGLAAPALRETHDA